MKRTLNFRSQDGLHSKTDFSTHIQQFSVLSKERNGNDAQISNSLRQTLYIAKNLEKSIYRHLGRLICEEFISATWLADETATEIRIRNEIGAHGWVRKTYMLFLCRVTAHGVFLTVFCCRSLAVICNWHQYVGEEMYESIVWPQTLLHKRMQETHADGETRGEIQRKPG